jgi:hypothetical protein
MTEAEKAEAMRLMLERNPEPKLSEAEKEAMLSGAMNVVAGGTPERLARFSGKAHEADGMARIVQKDGKLSVVLGEDFVVDAGPQLYVYASGNSNPSTSAELHAGGAWELGRLKSTSGMQTYALPDGVSLDQVRSIVVYCKPFRVVFAVASIQ